jgi:hypothetical protein
MSGNVGHFLPCNSWSNVLVFTGFLHISQHEVKNFFLSFSNKMECFRVFPEILFKYIFTFADAENKANVFFFFSSKSHSS